MKSKNNKKKNIKNNHSNIILFINHTMNYLTTLKIFHWTTDSYSAHKVSDKFYSKIHDLMDVYVETYLGHHNYKKKLQNKIKNITIKNITNNKDLISYTHDYKKKIKKIRTIMNDKKESELINVLDDILTKLDILLYLLTLYP